MSELDSPPIPDPQSPHLNSSPEPETRLAKFLCSFGGSVLPRPLDGRLRYAGGETRILAIPRDISFPDLLKKTREIFEGTDVIKYQQPDEDLDALVSVVNDDDVVNMMEEYDKLVSSGEAFTKLRIFLFCQSYLDAEIESPIFDEMSERDGERRYVDALNSLADFKPGFNSPDKENLSMRHSPWSAGYLSPNQFGDHSGPASPSGVKLGFEDLSEGAGWLPPGTAVQEKSGFPCNLGFVEGNNGNFCDHCHMAAYRQCVAPQHYYMGQTGQMGHFHGGLNNPSCADCYHNNSNSNISSNNNNNEGYHYYYNDPHGHDNRMWAPPLPHNQFNYRYEDPRTHRVPVPVPVPVPDPYIPDGNRLNYPYLHGNNSGFGTEINNNDMFHNIAQQQQQGEINNLESLYQVPQNLPPIPSLRRKMQQVHMGGNINGGIINPQFVRGTPDGTPNGGFINPHFIRGTPDGTPNGGNIINPHFIRGTPDGTPNGGNIINPQFIRATPDGTPNGGNIINPQFIRGTPDGTPNGGNIINPQFIRGTPDGTPNGSYINPQYIRGTPDGTPNINPLFLRGTPDGTPNGIKSAFMIGTPDGSPRVPAEYGVSRLNPNLPPIPDFNALQCQQISNILPVQQDFNALQCQQVMETPVIDEACKRGGGDLSFGTRLSVQECKDKEAVIVEQNGDVGDKEETIKKVSLEEEISNKKVSLQEETSEEKTNVDQDVGPEIKTDADESENLNGNADPEAEIEGHDELEENTKIEPTSAEQEAHDKGLQTIKNEDLEEIKELGSGTYGSVFHGKWRGSDVAIKRIKASCFAGRPSEREKLIGDFWKEAVILGSLHHPNVVSFYGVVRDGPDGGLATVTEFMVNGSLKQFLHKKDRTIDRRKRLIIAMDAAFGMEYLHGKNIVHFDLKCENLLVNMRDPHRPICKIGDLGLSKVKQHTLVSGGVRGTIPWMAPELLSGKTNKVSEKIDVYSFGICMWELLTGEEPYAEMHAASIIGGLVNNTLRPNIPTWCDPEWKSLMESCWSSDPTQRPSFSEISQKLRKMAAAINVK